MVVLTDSTYEWLTKRYRPQQRTRRRLANVALDSMWQLWNTRDKAARARKPALGGDTKAR